MSVLVLSAPDELLDLVSVIEPVLDLGSSLTDADLVLLLGLSGLVGGTGLESSGLGEPSGWSPTDDVDMCFSDLAFFLWKKLVIPEAILALKFQEEWLKLDACW